ncbi:MAG: asparagine synthase-related protein [Sulfuricella sp.]|nr:asparagine synthase-related protein [Sulfuricella sp.]
MSGLCGWWGKHRDEAGNRRLIEAMAAPMRRHEEWIAALSNGHGGLAGAGRCDVYRDGRVMATVFGSARCTAPIPGGAGQLARFVADGYLETGPDILLSLAGSFAVALVYADEVFLAIDRMGISSLTYLQRGNSLIFGSSADALNIHPLAAPEIDPQGIFNYLYFHMVPGPGTIYRGQQRLLPGSWLRFRNGRISTGRYWEMAFSERESHSFAALKEEFVALLQKAVGASAQERQVGAFLSGGTDSSTVSGMLGGITGKPARVYSIGFDAEGYDEMAYARLAADHFGSDLHDYYVTPDDVVGAVRDVAAAYDAPFGNASAVPAYYCARLAKNDGVRLMLAGDGGDELFGGNTRYAKQRIFSLYGALPAGVRKGLIEPVLYALPGGNWITPLRKARSYVEQASQPMPERAEAYNLLTRLGAARVCEPDFLAEVDPAQPIALLAEQWNGARAGTQINRMLALDLRFTLADNDLPKVSRMCELAGVEVAYPLLDDEIVAFSARLAPDLKLKGTKLRYFFKQALRDFLPHEILTKQKHGFGLPFGLWLQNHHGLRELAYDSLASLKPRGVVRPGFVDELIDTHRNGHAEYYGTLIWVLMMLELWYEKEPAGVAAR